MFQISSGEINYVNSLTTIEYTELDEILGIPVDHSRVKTQHVINNEVTQKKRHNHSVFIN